MANVSPSQSPPIPLGSRTVTEALGLDPQRLIRLHDPDGADGTLARLVVDAARQLDRLGQELADRAQWAATDLHRVATGKTQVNPLGVLQNSATQIDILAARRADAAGHLDQLIHAYRHVAAPGEAASPHATPLRTTPAVGSSAPSAPARAPRSR
ncbi:hypothetical protein ACFYN0_01245 [Streptomyces sp. NPDC006704]|uniref:hypothetical protein n=1 Tax=Streptomyces sp. NPDC006704 TaxID=3364760 RepID=UPI0036C2E8D2